MKKVLVGFLVSVISAASFAVVYDPADEVAVFQASLTQVSGGVQYPRPMALIMNRNGYSQNASSFTLISDNGIRCIKAPCPSAEKSTFEVTDVRESKSNTLHYTAVEVFRSGAHGRTMHVTDMGTHWQRPENRWNVTLEGGIISPEVSNYTGLYFVAPHSTMLGGDPMDPHGPVVYPLESAF